MSFHLVQQIENEFMSMNYSNVLDILNKYEISQDDLLNLLTNLSLWHRVTSDINQIRVLKEIRRRIHSIPNSVFPEFIDCERSNKRKSENTESEYNEIPLKIFKN